MPCYIRGRTIIREENLLKDVASSLGLTITEKGDSYLLHKNGDYIGFIRKGQMYDIDFQRATSQVKGLLQSYALGIVKKQARLKGWNISSVKTTEDNKIKVTMER